MPSPSDDSSQTSSTAPWAVIANPQAGRGGGAEAAHALEAALRAKGLSLEVHFSRGPGDAQGLAAEMARQGVGTVVAAGGDGTLHEVANGLLEGSSPPPRLGLLPVGGGNDYAKMLGLPANAPAEAARLLVRAEARPVDVGLVEGCQSGPEFVLNNVGLAFMASANATREKGRWLPGPLSYPLSGAWAYFTFRAETLRVSVDEVSIQARFMIVHLALGKYCGSGVCLTPESRLDQGHFQVYLVTERSKLKGLLQWPQIAAGRRLDDMTLLQGEKVRVEGPPEMLLHIDGEVRAVPSGILEVSLLPARLHVLHGAA